MRKLILGLSLALLVALPLFGEWQEETRITNTSGNSYLTSSGGWGIAADTNNVHISWYDYSYSNDRIRYVGFPIGSPPDAGAGTGLSSRSGYYPVVAANGSGNVQVSWRDGSSPYGLRFREYSDSWGSIINYGYSGKYNYYPAIVTDPSGNTHSVYHRYDGYYPYYYRIYYQRRDAGSSSFTSPKLIYTPPYSYRDAEHPSICLTSEGYIHVVWTQDWSPYNLGYAYSPNNGSTFYTFSIPNTRAYYGGPDGSPSMCADHDDNLYVAYVDISSSPYQIAVVKRTGTTWSSRVRISASSSSCYYPSMCCDAFGNIWVVWRDRRSGIYEVYYNRLPAGAEFATGWEGEQRLTSEDGNNSYIPQIAADPHGNVHVCWYDYRDGNHEIYYNWFCPVPPNDVAPVSIDAPADTVWSEYTYTPQATVASFAEDTSFTFDVVCEFDSAGTVVYSDTAGVIDLAGGDSVEVSFASWTAGEADGLSYTMTVITLLAEDTKPANDTLSKTVTAIWPPRDVAPVAIITPPDRVWAGCIHIPRAVIKNFWESTESFDVLCEFDSAGTIIYSDVVTVTDLAGGDSVEVEFATWSAGAEDEFDYLMTVTTLHPKDLNPANDTISKIVAARKAVPDLDIQDYAGNLSANTMELTSVTNSIVVGSYVMVNPDNGKKNVDLYDGPANIDLDLTYSCTDLATYGGGWTIGAANVNPDLNEVSWLALGSGAQNIAQVYVPNETPFETYVGEVRVIGTAEDGSTDADKFTLKVTVVVNKGGGHPSSFGGEPLAQGNRLYWSNFGFGEQGFNLYRAESEEFTRLNDACMNCNEYTDADIVAEVDYRYKLGLLMADESEVLLGPLSLTSSQKVGSLVLEQNWPNPWTDATEISYFLPKGISSTTLKVYDISGKLVKTLAEGSHDAGAHSVIWDGKDERGIHVSSGVYFYMLSTDDQRQTNKMLLLR
ncbi:hypothetical protein CEE36_05785 [candidate division TA06 bacterium B3_TA06]|uniref:FlgD/Vpr Ig-like domain-containing protein n=1 Tax=candidate division TA06 bacterium B3_TA06 TaxID=2012487 RepID=A0A532V720_UNCT6|nr:MAG: hypothetical protein CEE36_05785 [candidate division TA06 bacterium B3_TA06]